MARLSLNFLDIFSGNSKPKLLILGVQKAGTTTLFDLLDSIPEFCGANVKEVGFYTKDMFYLQGKDWYLKQFSQCDRKAIKFEATPEYLYYPDVPQKIFSFNNATKFIIVLREPSARCYSAWNMFRSFNKHSAKYIYEMFTQYANPPTRDAIRKLLFAEQFPAFEQAVLDDIGKYTSKSNNVEPSFVRRGIYCEQIENYLQYFPLSAFLFLEQRELSQPESVLKKISNFLNIKINIESIKAPVVSNIGEYEENEEQVSDTIAMLKAFYRPHNEKLFKQIGIRYDWNEQ